MAEQAKEISGGAPQDNEARSFAVQTFTARYDLGEDRICMKALEASGAKHAIYLTRRLMDQTIPVLAKHLEDKAPKGVPSDVIQSMAQERVRQACKTAPSAEPVQTDLKTPSWLCTTIQMRKQSGGLEVILTGDVVCKAHILLTDPHLRTVLDIFCNTYEKAGWDLRVFQEWLGRQQVCAGLGTQVRLNCDVMLCNNITSQRKTPIQLLRRRC